ncbi:MAG: PPOX class F420-dependent oxidoreductase [Dehalococcoidia bacterium]
MAVKLSDQTIKLIKGKNFAFVGTLMPDGQPQVSPMWVEYDGSHIVLNSEVKRVKVQNLRRDARVSVSIADMENPYQYVEIRGRVVDMTTEGAPEHIDRLANKYLGQDTYPYNQPGDQRIIMKVEPLSVSGTATGSETQAA